MSSDAELILVYEPEAACRDRLVADRIEPKRALEISSYLAQSTDIAPEFDKIAQACAARSVRFSPILLDDAATALQSRRGSNALVWTLTDGIAYFRGGAAPTLARLAGLRTFGADDSLFGLCQDKFRSGAVLRALGLPAPKAGIARNGQWIVKPPDSRSGWFVKPNRLGAKIGIWPDSHVKDEYEALGLSRRIFEAYRDNAIVQPYVGGRNVRASFLAVTPEAGVNDAGVVFVDAGGDFQTMADSMALYGDTGATAKSEGSYREPDLVPVAKSQPGADTTIRAICQEMMSGLGLGGVFSADFRVEADDTVHLIEFEVCPGLPCFDFRAYCTSQWKLSLAEAMAAAAATRLTAVQTFAMQIEV